MDSGLTGQFKKDFNPRTREGCDCSLHKIPQQKWSYFNPRTREGCDYLYLPVTAWLPDFNPRTREGCDSQKICTKFILFQYFNPRTREGCDDIGKYLLANQKGISIHAPVKGATKRHRGGHIL